LDSSDPLFDVLRLSQPESCTEVSDNARNLDTGTANMRIEQLEDTIKRGKDLPNYPTGRFW